MTRDEDFHALIRRVRAGDQQAAADLVRRYESQVRRVVRLRLTDPRLGQLLDSEDVCQSVLANFFVRAAAGQFELDTPEQLLRLLVTMARNKLLNLAQRHQAERRDNRRLEAGGGDVLESVAAPQATPSAIVAAQDLLEQVCRQLSEEERHLADQRALGWDWVEIAREVGGNPDSLRKKLARAVDRVARQLKLDEVPHE